MFLILHKTHGTSSLSQFSDQQKIKETPTGFIPFKCVCAGVFLPNKMTPLYVQQWTMKT